MTPRPVSPTSGRVAAHDRVRLREQPAVDRPRPYSALTIIRRTSGHKGLSGPSLAVRTSAGHDLGSWRRPARCVWPCDAWMKLPDGQLAGEAGISGRRALDLDPAAVRFDDQLGDCEAQPGAAALAIPARVDAVEALEDMGQVLGRDARSLVPDPEAGAAVRRAAAQFDATAVRCVAQRVVHQV